jgi:PAS domain S-box-containing protein
MPGPQPSGDATDVSRASCSDSSGAREGLAQSCRFSWSAPGYPSLSGDPRFQNDPISTTSASQFGDWFARRSRGEAIQVNLSETDGEARKWFEETSTFSMLSVPILANGIFWGSLGFDDCRSERIWDEMEVDLLKTAAALVASAVERALADDELRRRDWSLVEAQRIGHVGNWEVNLETNTVVWSDEGLRIFGLEHRREPWTYEENLARIHPEDRARVVEVGSAMRKNGESAEFEYRVVRPGGEVRVVYQRAEPIRDSTGRPTGLIGTVHDITELKATEGRLRASEERYELAARGAEVGLFDWDVPTDAAYFSPRDHEILGVNSQTLGASIAALCRPYRRIRGAAPASARASRRTRAVRLRGSPVDAVSARALARGSLTPDFPASSVGWAR